MRNSAVRIAEPEVVIYDTEKVLESKPEQKPDLRLLKQRNVRARVNAILWIALIFAAFFLVTSRYSNLTKLNYEIADIKSQLEEQKSINSSLSVILDQKTNIMMIRHSAETELGMHEPDNHQITYIEVPRANKVTIENSEEDSPDDSIGLLENIKAFIAGN